MIQFTDAELIRIKASVEFAYDTNETLKIAEKIGDYLVTPQTKTMIEIPYFSLKDLELLQLFAFKSLDQFKVHELMEEFDFSENEARVLLTMSHRYWQHKSAEESEG